MKLSDEGEDDLSSSTTPEARLAMMWELAEQAWILAGRDIPEYERDAMPGNIIRKRQ